MRLRLRLLYIFFKSLFIKKKSSVLDDTILKLMVFPNDVDIKYVTNDRYLSFMDLGRIFFIFSYTNILLMIRKKWIPVATNIFIQYRYPLKLFQTFNLSTRIVWWDHKHFYLTQKFEKNNRVLCSAIVCATFMSEKGLVPTSDILQAMNKEAIRPEKPDFIETFQNNHPPHKI